MWWSGWAYGRRSSWGLVQPKLPQRVFFRAANHKQVRYTRHLEKVLQMVIQGCKYQFALRAEFLAARDECTETRATHILKVATVHDDLGGAVADDVVE